MESQKHSVDETDWTQRYLHMWELSLPYALHQLQLLPGEHDVLIIVLIINGAQRLARVVPGQQSLQPVFLLLGHDLVGVQVIADVVLIAIPLQWHPPHCSQTVASHLAGRH